MKRMIFVKRAAGLDPEGFRSWWAEKQRPLAVKVPGLRGYTMSFVADGEDGDYDAIAELRFDSIAAADAGLASPEGQASLAEAEAHLSRRDVVDLNEYKFVDTGRPSSFKMVSMLKMREDLDRAAFKEWWLVHHAPMVVVFPELTRYQVDLTEEGPESAADGLAEVCFADLESLKRVTSSPLVKGVQEDSVAHTRWRYRLYVEETRVL